MRLIDADELIQKVKDGAWIQIEDGYGNAIGREKLNPDFAFVINEMPTIDTHPAKRGKWIYSTTIGGMRYYQCTNCSDKERDCIADENEVRWYNFCPNCGAKMDGGDTDET